jgi:hypothetical protein
MMAAAQRYGKLIGRLAAKRGCSPTLSLYRAPPGEKTFLAAQYLPSSGLRSVLARINPTADSYTGRGETRGLSEQLFQSMFGWFEVGAAGGAVRCSARHSSMVLRTTRYPSSAPARGASTTASIHDGTNAKARMPTRPRVPVITLPLSQLRHKQTPQGHARSLPSRRLRIRIAGAASPSHLLPCLSAESTHCANGLVEIYRVGGAKPMRVCG